MRTAYFAFDEFFEFMFLFELVVFVPYLIIITRPMRLKKRWPSKTAVLEESRRIPAGDMDAYEDIFVFEEGGVEHRCVSRNAYRDHRIGRIATIYVDPRKPTSCYEAVSQRQLVRNVLIVQSIAVAVALFPGFHTAWKIAHGEGS